MRIFSFPSRLFGTVGRISVVNSIENTMVYVPEDQKPSEEPAKPTFYLVWRGLSPNRGQISILRVGKNLLKFRMNAEYYHNGSCERVFSLARGETISLTLAGLCDATARCEITYFGKVRRKDRKL